MIEYFLAVSPSAEVVVKVHDGIVSFIPDDPANPDWQAYQEWLAEGNTPEPWPSNEGGI